MKRILPLALGLAVLCVPATAQRQGSVNRGAPTIEQSIQFEGASLKVSYLAITWASGRTMEAAMTKGDRGQRVRQQINSGAESSPLGSLEASAPFSIGGKDVPAGSYKLMFTIDDELQWHMVAVAKEGDSRVDWVLPLADSAFKSPRLTMSLMAGEANGTGKLWVAFGSKACDVEYKPGAEKSEGK